MATKHNVKHRDAAEIDGPDDIDWSKVKVIGRGIYAKRGVRMPLRSLRAAIGKTQVDVSEATGIAQSEVSRIEGRDDALVSTLRRYVEALGGKLEIVAAFPLGHRITIDLDEAAREAR